MWRRIRALVQKEFLALLKDKRSRTVVFIPPILQLLVFGYAASFDLNRIRFAVYDEDRSVASRELVARFAGSHNFLQVATITSEHEIAPLVDAKRALLVLHIGPQFSHTDVFHDLEQTRLVVEQQQDRIRRVEQSFAPSGIVFDSIMN